MAGSHIPDKPQSWQWNVVNVLVFWSVVCTAGFAGSIAMDWDKIQGGAATVCACHNKEIK